MDRSVCNVILKQVAVSAAKNSLEINAQNAGWDFGITHSAFRANASQQELSHRLVIQKWRNVHVPIIQDNAPVR